MKALSTTLLAGGIGIAALVGAAAPAAAQYYPGYPAYPSNPSPYGYGYNNGGGVIGAIIGALGGYGQYPYGNYGYNQVNDRYAVDQCARIVQSRLGGSYGGYGQPYGYSNRGYGGGQIAGITRVDRRSNGTLRVYGVAMSNTAYGNYSRYGDRYQASYPDLRFNCKIDRAGRVYDVDINRTRYNRNDYYYGYRGY